MPTSATLLPQALPAGSDHNLLSPDPHGQGASHGAPHCLKTSAPIAFCRREDGDDEIDARHAGGYAGNSEANASRDRRWPSVDCCGRRPAEQPDWAETSSPAVMISRYGASSASRSCFASSQSIFMRRYSPMTGATSSGVPSGLSSRNCAKRNIRDPGREAESGQPAILGTGSRATALARHDNSAFVLRTPRSAAASRPSRLRRQPQRSDPG